MPIEEAAISQGSSKFKAFFCNTMPMMSNGMVSGAPLSWISTITGLSSCVILCNYRTTTLAIQICAYVSRGSYGIAAAVSAILAVMATLSLAVFMMVSKDKKVAF